MHETQPITVGDTKPGRRIERALPIAFNFAQLRTFGSRSARDKPPVFAPIQPDFAPLTHRNSHGDRGSKPGGAVETSAPGRRSDQVWREQSEAKSYEPHADFACHQRRLCLRHVEKSNNLIRRQVDPPGMSDQGSARGIPPRCSI